MLIVILLQDNAIPFYLFFTIWVMFSNISYIYFFFFSTQNINSNLHYFSHFFQLSCSDGKFIPSHLYVFIKGLIFVILSGLFLYDLTRLLQRIESIFFFFVDGIYSCNCFFVQSRKSTQNSPQFGLTLWHL